jgi:glycine/D-amino acid oxidase-like deaminating enzyme
VLDRRDAAHGSTAGNTGLVLYEVDTMVHRLMPRIGPGPAVRAYRRCRDAVIRLGQFAQAARIRCEFVPRQSLFLAATPAHVPRLRREFDARSAAGLEVAWWTRRRIASECSLPHAAAIISSGAAEIDPYRFTYGMLLAAQRAGARIHDRTAVTRRISRRDSAEIHTARGSRVRARDLVIATGYEAATSLAQRAGRLHSTFALISEPISPDAFKEWPADRALIWDTADPYLYLRTTADHRAFMGGYDETFRDPRERYRRLRVKALALQRRFHQLFPRIPLEVATAWAGTFGTSDDGLPCIGRHPAGSHTWYALGFGGNGITFSMIAAEIIRAGILGDEDPDAALFGFERFS